MDLPASSIRQVALAPGWETASVTSFQAGPTPAPSIYRVKSEDGDVKNDAQSIRAITRADYDNFDAVSVQIQDFPTDQDEQQSSHDAFLDYEYAVSQQESQTP